MPFNHDILCSIHLDQIAGNEKECLSQRTSADRFVHLLRAETETDLLISSLLLQRKTEKKPKKR